MSYAIAHASLAHTYGNITCFITEYVKSLFPKDYFKTVHISSTIAYREFNIFQNTKKEFIRKNKPMLIIRPRVELNDTDTFLYNTFMTTRMTDNYMDTCFTNLQPFVCDVKNGLHVKFLLNRLKMYFDVTIVNSTQISQLNTAHFLKNRVRQDKPFFLQTSLENYVPREIFQEISKTVGIPMYDSNGSVRNFLEYLNGVSMYPISYKMKNATGNDEFFRFYPVNIDTMFQGLSIDDGNKRGMVDDAYTTTFTISTEFNAAGLYYYFTEEMLSSGHDVFMSHGEDDSQKLIPIYTIDNLYANKYDDGWNLYASPIYKIDIDSFNVGYDLLDFSPFINNSLQSALDYHEKHGISLDIFLKVFVTRDSELLEPIKDYDIDFKTMTLTTKKLNADSTYRLIMHVNTNYINQLVTDVYNLDVEK